MAWTAITIAMAGLIAYLSLVPGTSRSVSWMPPWLQNVGHVGCYAVLAFLCAFSLDAVPEGPRWRLLAAFLSATAFGVLMERLQNASLGRHASLADALRNAIGAAIGVAVAFMVFG